MTTATEQAKWNGIGALVDNVPEVASPLELALARLTRENHQFKEAVMSSAAGICITDATQSDNPIIFANPAFLAMTGYEEEEVLGHNCRFLQGASTNPRTLLELREAIAQGRGIKRCLVNYRKNRTPFWNELTINPIYDEHGTLVNFVGIQHDITERMENQAALQRAHDEMELRVRLRTAELAKTNQELRLEILEHQRTEEELSHSKNELRALAARLGNAQEAERVRIAREIHDELGQMLTGLKMQLSWIENRLSDDELINTTREMSERIDTTIGTVRRIASDLRPGVLDRFGLKAALQWQAEEFQKNAGIRCACTAELDDSELDDTQKTAIFRITQEALTNVARHAHATRATISLREKSGALHLQIKDNGRGFEPEANHSMSLGIVGMRERALLLGGEFHVQNVAGKGTTIKVCIPCDKRNL